MSNEGSPFISHEWAEAPVFVLGAGFSKAIADTMPVTRDLEEALASKGIEVPNVGLEAWLGYLAERQPHLTRVENLENAHRSAVVLDEIARTIRKAEMSVRASAPPQWLLDFVCLCRALRSSVVSFNYDPLYDAAAAAFVPQDGPARSIRVHGSLEEGWDPEVPGLVEGWERPPAWGITVPDVYCWESAGRLEPFVVPPVSIKSPFYGVPEIRNRWLLAASELQTASSITLLGYSMPAGDYAAEFMIGDVLRTDPEIRVNVADLCPEPVEGRIRAAGGAVGWSEGGPTAIAAMVERMAPGALLWTLQEAVEAGPPGREVDLRFTSPMSIGHKFPAAIDHEEHLIAEELLERLPAALEDGRLDGRLVVGARRRGWNVRTTADGSPVEEIEVLVSAVPSDFMSDRS